MPPILLVKQPSHWEDIPGLTDSPDKQVVDIKNNMEEEAAAAPACAEVTTDAAANVANKKTIKRETTRDKLMNLAKYMSFSSRWTAQRVGNKRTSSKKQDGDVDDKKMMGLVPQLDLSVTGGKVGVSNSTPATTSKTTSKMPTLLQQQAPSILTPRPARFLSTRDPFSESANKTQMSKLNAVEPPPRFPRGVVLRFYGYFCEAVRDSPVENCRLRELVLHYFLDDDTVAILEPKQEKGMPHGDFLKRIKLEDGKGNPVTLSKFRCGSTVLVYGRGIRLTGMDKFTENYYRDQGLEAGLPEETPENQIVINERQREKLFDSSRKITTASAAKNMLTPRGGDGEQEEVLRFFAFTENKHRVRVYYIVVFYPEDSSIEVRDHASGKRVHKRAQVETTGDEPRTYPT
ncbi:unnamed protein product [Amoebophrya sp. A25]|nr:unnamed protein product [Amoebophrya sp. A25]|eukprot:GSA25T00014761001.1